MQKSSIAYNGLSIARFGRKYSINMRQDFNKKLCIIKIYVIKMQLSPVFYDG
jgi:hypothetical protein